MSSLKLIGTPVTTSRQWTTALAPRNGGGWNFITCSYNYPQNVATEYVVLHLETGAYLIFDGPNGVYPNSNFQIPSVGTDITVNNQLRAPDGTIFFVGAIGGATVFLAYYDPTDEHVHFVSNNVAPTGNSFCYSAIFNHDGTKLYIGTQSDTIPSVFVVDVATKAITLVGSGGDATPGFPNYAYYLGVDEGPGADWIYFARGQFGWQLIAIKISTGDATVLYTTTGPGFQFIQLTGDVTSCRAQVFDNGVETDYYVFDGAISLTPPGTTRDCTPYNNPLINPPVIDWTHGIGQVLYQLPPFYNIKTPDTAQWHTIYASLGIAKGVPSSIYQCQETTGNLADTGGAGRTLVATSTTGLSYAQVTPEWEERLSLHFTEAVANRFTATVPNANANSLLNFFYVQLYADPNNIKSIIETDAGYAEGIPGPLFRADANSAVSGAVDPGTSWHFVAVQHNIGVTPHKFYVITEQEVIEAANFDGSGTTLVLGGSGGTTTAPMNINYGASLYGTDAELSLAQIATIINALGWSSPIVTPPQVTRNYTVQNKSPIVLESLVTELISNQPLTNGEQYGGFAKALQWFGAWAGGPSQPRTFNIGPFIYMCGYPDGVLYRYDESQSWAPDGSDTGNPALLGAYSSGVDQGMKYPYFNRYDSATNRIFCSGRRERDHDGCSLGWYDRGAQTFSAPKNADPLTLYRAPAGLAVSESLGLVVFSGDLFDDSTAPAKLLVYDTDLNLLHQWTPISGSRNTGNLYNTSDANILLGFGNTAGDAALAYRVNITTGTVVQTLDMSAFTFGPAEQILDSQIYIILDEKLFEMNTDTLEMKPISASVGFTPSYISKARLGTVYMTHDAQLYALSDDAAPEGPQPSVGLYWFADYDPTQAPGMNAPKSQLLIRTDVPSIYYKNGPADTDWVRIGVG